MCDQFEVSKKTQVTERFVSVIEPKIVGGVAVIDDVRLVVKDGTEPKITVKTAKGHLRGESYNVYLIDYTLSDDQYTFEISFEM